MHHPPALPADHTGAAYSQKIGVVLVNLGTPDGTGYWAVRRYLKEFLSDRRVVEVPRLVWWLVLNLIVLTFRSTKSGHAYAAIWDKKHNASPLRVITDAQATALQERLGDDVVVRFAMRYGQPNIPTVLDEMKAAGCARVVVAPLYPQYSGSTVGAVVDEVARWLLRQRWQPTVRMMAPYYDHPAYIDAVAKSVRGRIEALGWVPDVVVASFHGLPQVYCRKGDVYYCHSHKTARLLAEKLDLSFRNDGHVRGKGRQLVLSFQSRFGKARWLQPYTDRVLVELAQGSAKKVMVVAPGFAADCVETLEELDMRGREAFTAAGGTHFDVVPCLNASDSGMDLLEGLVESDLMGWR